MPRSTTDANSSEMRTRCPELAEARGGRLAAPAWLEDVFSHAREAYPEECCGFVLRRRAQGAVASAHLVRRCRNAEGTAGAERGGHARSRRDGFLIQPAELLDVHEAMAGSGDELAFIYHSHVGGGARLSPRDRSAAAPGGAPLLPGVGQVVVAVVSGEVRGFGIYAWDPARNDYALQAASGS